MYSVTDTNGIDNTPQMLQSNTWMKDYCVDGTEIIDEANNIKKCYWKLRIKFKDMDDG